MIYYGHNGNLMHLIYIVSSYKEYIRCFAAKAQKPKTNKIKISNKADQKKPVKLSNKFDAKPV